MLTDLEYLLFHSSVMSFTCHAGEVKEVVTYMPRSCTITCKGLWLMPHRSPLFGQSEVVLDVFKRSFYSRYSYLDLDRLEGSGDFVQRDQMYLPKTGRTWLTRLYRLDSWFEIVIKGRNLSFNRPRLRLRTMYYFLVVSSNHTRKHISAAFGCTRFPFLVHSKNA